MPINTTRSGRTVKNPSSKQSKWDALEILERQRRGEKVDIGIKEDEPLFDEVDEEEYKRTRKSGFVVDAESDDEYGSDDLDFIDDEDYEDEKKKRSDGRLKGNRAKEVVADPKQRSMRSFIGSSGTSKSGTFSLLSSSTSISKSTKKVEMDSEDILSQMLFDVPISTNSSIKKPLTRLRALPRLTPTTSHSSRVSHLPCTSSLSTTPSRRLKAEHDQPSKRQRVASPDLLDNSSLFSEPEFDNSQLDDQPVSAIYQQMSTQESEIFMEPEVDNSGIEVAPLDADTKKNLQFANGEDGRQYTHFYWCDCTEGPTQGTVYFFGRIQVPNNKFVSCCVIVKNVRRSIYLLIASNCTYEETLGEFTHITAKKFQIKNFTSQKVTKRFSFDKDVPLEAEYVQIDYPATQPLIPADFKGETFSKVLNVNQSPMEKLILDLRLRGPTWLKLIEPMASSPQITWTRIELVLESPSNLLIEENPVNLSRPYFCVLSLALQTYAHPTIVGRNDIVAISVMTNTCFRLDQCLNKNNKGCGHFVMMARPPASQKEGLRLPYDFQKAVEGFNRTRFELANNERELLVNFMEKFNQLDPDIVVGHDLLNYDFETLVKQMAIHKVGAWDKLGRFKRNTLPSSKKAFPYLFSGRILCDIKKSAEELMQLRSYDLNELALQILDRKRVEYNHDSLVESYKTSTSLIQMLNATWQDVDSIFSILVELNIIPLALKITNITGNILSRTLSAGRSERNEYLLLHAFHEDNFICPAKVFGWEKKNSKNNNEQNGDDQAEYQGRRKAAYTGGLVLEPKAGFYESCILLMDFNSLYPSIIQEFNICFSTVKPPENSNEEGAVDVPNESVDTGILPAQLKQLVRRRRDVKAKLKLCKDPIQSILLDIEQRALKLTANSMYGCLGFEYSRFYAKHLASLVTSKGREILMNTKAIVENIGYEVIYGDTDSLMIDTKLSEYQEVMQRGRMIKEEINRRFKLLEIDIDGVYQPLLLLKKKNYAGASLSTSGNEGEVVKKIETKGLDSVRRDRAVVAKEAGERILSMIMESGKDICQIVQDIHAYLKELCEKVSKNELPLEKYLISKQLNKNPDEYKETKGIGHVTIALRLNADTKKTRKLKSGDVIDYAICTDGTTESANQRGYTLEEMSANQNLKIDHDYYLCQQIYPAVTRICDKLPFTSAYAIAEAMGIESNSSIKIPRESTAAQMKDQLVSKGEQRFINCEPLTIECPSCTYIEVVRSKTRKPAKGKLLYSLVECSNCKARYASSGRKVVVQVIAQLKRLTLALYNNKFTCPDCDFSTRNIFGPFNEHGKPACIKCAATLVADMDDRTMDLQLSFFKYLLDINNIDESSESTIEKPTTDVIDMYKTCFEEVLGALKMSFINTIDAQTVFSMVSFES